MHSNWHNLLELSVQLLKVSAFFTVVVLPATLICLRECRMLSVTSRLALGISCGFALFVIGAWYVGLKSLDDWGVFWLLQCIAVAWRVWRTRRRHLATMPGDDTYAVSPDAARWQWLVAVPLLAGGLLQLYALHFSELPLGVDSAFHCVVGQRVLDAGRVVNDLWPLDDLQLNYPIGSHLWLAVAAQWTGLEVHQVFRHSITLALWGGGLVVAACAEKLFGSAIHAAAASFAFVFCSFQASLFPYTWGGLPSLMAVWLGLAGVYAVFSVPGQIGLLTSSLLFGGMVLTHHHTMVAMLSGIGVAAAIGFWLVPKERRTYGRVLVALAVGMAVAGVYLVPLASRLGEIHATGIIGYREQFRWPWGHLWDWGPALLVTAAVGVTLRKRSESGAMRFLLIVLAGFWLCAFAALDYGARVVTAVSSGVPSTPFTPSRFLFDVQWILAIFASGGLVRVLRWRPGQELPVPSSARSSTEVVRVAGERSGLAVFVKGLIVTLALTGTIIWAVRDVQPRWKPVPSDALLPIGRWVRESLTINAFVMLNGFQDVWLTYACRRESPSLFVPISEPATTPRRTLRDSLVQRPFDRTWAQWSERLAKPIYLLSHAQDRPMGLRPIHVSGHVAVFDLNSRDADQ
ncbi:MAG: hypothetical protein HY000_11435 [Planctomycetes bacterium]|nr:hypothetical protein [Planctomycetota bacterium]